MTEYLSGCAWLAVALLMGIFDLLWRSRRKRVSAMGPDDSGREGDVTGAQRTDGKPGRGDTAPSRLFR